MDDIIVQLMDMDTMIPEHLVKNDDDSYTIFLNARLSHDEQLRAYQHALSHIRNEDYEKSDIQSIEFHAHELEASEKPVPAVNEYERRIRRLQQERKNLQKALKEKEKEINFIIDLYGADYFARAAKYRWLYGESE